MPKIDDLDTLGGSTILLKIDLKSGYDQMRVQEEDKGEWVPQQGHDTSKLFTFCLTFFNHKEERLIF